MGLVFEDVCFDYEKGHAPCFLEHVSLTVSRGSVLGVFGPSGSGKTTLALLAAGLLNPRCGRVLVDGYPARRQGTSICMAFQIPEDMFLGDSVSDEMVGILKERGQQGEDAEQRARQAITWAGLEPEVLWARHPLHLSHGELRRLSLALVWEQDWDVLILDEPTVGLECRVKRGMMDDIVRRCHREGKVVVIAGHDTSLLLPLIDYGIVLNGGKILIQGSREELLEHHELITAAGLSLPQLADLAITLKGAGLPVERIWLDCDQASEDIAAMLSV
ncbi:MAG: energy-coupling factor ABC transporter ATP-binding protein [bacterium]